MKTLFTALLFLVVLVLAFMLGARNDQLVEVNFLLAMAEVRLSVLMALMLLSGVVLASLAFMFVWFKLKWQLRRQTRVTRPGP